MDRGTSRKQGRLPISLDTGPIELKSPKPDSPEYYVVALDNANRKEKVLDKNKTIFFFSLKSRKLTYLILKQTL